jgi:hypothetical protein
MEINYIEVNTNGARFSRNIGFLKKYKEAGTDSL